jgi:hypothetical protein
MGNQFLFLSWDEMHRRGWEHGQCLLYKWDEERVERIRDILVHARNRWHYY